MSEYYLRALLTFVTPDLFGIAHTIKAKIDLFCIAKWESRSQVSAMQCPLMVFLFCLLMQKKRNTVHFDDVTALSQAIPISIFSFILINDPPFSLVFITKKPYSFFFVQHIHFTILTTNNKKKTTNQPTVKIIGSD